VTSDPSPVKTLDYGVRGKVLIYKDGEALAHAAAQTFVRAVGEAVAARGLAHVAFSGGTTPKRMAELLAGHPYRDQVPWANIEFAWGDERWVSLSSPESNAGVAQRTLLDHVPVSPSRVNPFPSPDEIPDPKLAASMFETQLKMVSGTTDGAPRFDLVFLGMGDDGHTASLFPGTAAIQEEDALVVSQYVDKLEADRLTFTPPLINAGREIVFLVGGAGKAETLARVLDGPIDVETLPSQAIRPTDGSLTWLVDEAAAAKLTGAVCP
jgi:6-phosphogluconolactonase